MILRVSTRLMNICVASLCRACRVDVAERVIADGIRLGCLPDVVTYNTLVVAYCRLVGFDAAWAVLHRMREAGLRPDVVTYNSLIAGSARGRSLKLSFHLFEELLRVGLRPDVRTYNNLMHCLFMSGCPEAPDHAVRVLKSMESANLAPSSATYNILINGLCKRGEAREALRLFRYLEGVGFPIDLVTFNTLIDGLFKSGRFGTARRLFLELLGSGRAPNVVTYTTMMKGCSRSRRFGGVLAMLGEIRRTGCRFDAFAYCTVISVLIKMGMMEAASCLLEEMSAHCGVLDSVCCNTQINLFFKLGKVGDALDLLNQVDENDEYTLSILIDGFCRNNRIHDAFNLLKNVATTSTLSNLVPYNCFIGALCKQGRVKSMDFAMTLFDEMEVKDSFTYTSLLHGLCKLGRFREAFRLMVPAVRKGVRLPTSVQRAVLIGLRSSSRHKWLAKKLKSEIFKAKFHLQESAGEKDGCM